MPKFFIAEIHFDRVINMTFPFLSKTLGLILFGEL